MRFYPSLSNPSESVEEKWSSRSVLGKMYIWLATEFSKRYSTFLLFWMRFSLYLWSASIYFAPLNYPLSIPLFSFYGSPFEDIFELYNRKVIWSLNWDNLLWIAKQISDFLQLFLWYKMKPGPTGIISDLRMLKHKSKRSHP